MAPHRSCTRLRTFPSVWLPLSLTALGLLGSAACTSSSATSSGTGAGAGGAGAGGASLAGTGGGGGASPQGGSGSTSSGRPSGGGPNAGATSGGGAAPTIADTPILDGTWYATELLGRPQANSVTLSVVPAVGMSVRVVAHSEAGGAELEWPAQTGVPGVPNVFELTGLEPNQAYVYQVRFTRDAEATEEGRPEGQFHTQRPAGEPFVFTLQADSHLDDKSDVELYHRTLELARAASPDFHIDLGDTFMCDKHSAPFTGVVHPAETEEVVRARYLSERQHFGLLAHSAPLFLVNGNHEGETGFNLDGTPDNVAVWATLARKTYYPGPEPLGIYSTSATSEPLVGARENPYAWTWGDALFVVLDPFWYTQVKVKGSDRWGWTLGKAQYQWLRSTLLGSDAKYKFVFAHHLVGGNHSASRGGVEAAPFFEWGGKEMDGTDTFAKNRPGWDKPVHQLFVEAGVSAFFHGHDHVYVHQSLDGVVYQEVPQPSATNYRNGPQLAEEGGYTSGTILGSSGHLRVSVTSAEAKVEYVRSYLPKDEAADRVHGSVDHSYVLKPR